MEVTFHRFVLAEFNTHRVFSRNSASSRAIPVEKQLRKIIDHPAIPVEWGINKSGMQADIVAESSVANDSQEIWLESANKSLYFANELKDLGIHKQVTNRLLEPFMWHTVIVTSVDYENFFKQRCSPLAQPEIRVAAEKMEAAYRESKPFYCDYGQWHLPYLSVEEQLELENSHPYGITLAMKISAARCARVSYLTHDGVRDFSKDLELFERLVTADPPPWSPLEHVATPLEVGLSSAGNFVEFRKSGTFDNFYRPYGWAQLRHNLGVLEC
jgi:thymidylate synthase ThyX